MNKCIFSGFISSDIKSDNINLKNGEVMRKCSFNIACSRKSREKTADFPRVIALGRNAENIEKFFSRGQGIEVICHVQTGSYEGKNGRVYTTDLIVDEFEFAKSRKSDEESTPVNNSYGAENQSNDTHTGGATFGEMVANQNEPPKQQEEEFINIPENISDDELDDLPFL